MRILIEIRGGAFVGATVERCDDPTRKNYDADPLTIIVADHDNLEAGDPLNADGMDYETATPEELDAILDGIREGGM